MNDFNPGTAQEPLNNEFNQSIIGKMSSDMYFLGIYSIVVGALACLTIIGAAIGIPQIFAGLRLREAADAYKDFINTNNIGAIQYAFDRQQRYFRITKILAIVGMVLLVLIIILQLAIILFLSSHTSNLINRTI